MARWKKGERPVGRAKGTPNKVTVEIRQFCREVLSGEEYRKALRERIRKGKLSPPVEVMIWGYAYGKPPEKVELTINDAHRMSDHDLEVTVERLLFEMRETPLGPAPTDDDDEPAATFAFPLPESGEDPRD